jgi:peptidoglycan biosynthesis protein MviN/MurJ (putative lipid II flippase)
VTASNHVGPAISGIIALFPNVFLSLIIVLHPRLGGPATAAVIANGLWGLIGFSFAIVTLHVAALPLGSVAALSLALAVAVGWNFGMWWVGRHRRPMVKSS